jgi:hypothetical protein
VRRALPVTVAITLTATGILASITSTASAGTVDGVSVTGHNQYLKPGCGELPTISYTVPAATESWTLTAEVAGPGSPGSDQKFPPAPTSGTMSAHHCGSDGPGVYTVKAIYDDPGTRHTAVTTSYTVSKAPGRVSMKPSRTSVKTGQNITFSGATSYMDGSSYRSMPGWVTLQWRRAGTTTWHNWTSFWTDGSGKYSKTYAYPLAYGVVFRATVARYWVATAYSSQTWVARTADSTSYANCTALHAVYAHGVGRSGAVDKTSGTKVTTFYRNTSLYNRNTKLDRDKDGIACEKR